MKLHTLSFAIRLIGLSAYLSIILLNTKDGLNKGHLCVADWGEIYMK